MNSHLEDSKIKSNSLDVHLLARLFKYAIPFWFLLLISLISMIFAVLADLARPYMIKIAIDNYIKLNDFDGVFKIGIYLTFIVMLGFVFNYIQTYTLAYIGQRVIHNMRQDVYSHIINQSFSFFNRNPVGRLVTRVTNDLENLNELYTSVLVSLIKDATLLIGIIIMMLKLDYRLALKVFICLPIIFFLTWIFRKKSREAYRQVRSKLALINTSLNENLMGISIIQFLGQEAKVKDDFFKINKAHRDSSLAELFVFAIFRPSVDLIFSLILTILLWYGGIESLNGAIEFGVLFAFISYLEQFFHPIYDLAEKFNIIQSSLASGERIFELLDEDDTMACGNILLDKNSLKGSIEFKNVWFSYKDEDWILKDISFKINPGETIALVGHTGSGKSTIISLLSRLYDIQRGQILLDGLDIREYDLKSLRSSIAYVLQDVFLFTGSISENIKLGNNDISSQKIKDSIKYVNAEEFVTKLTGSYEAPVQENGATFSTGEKQLLSFARALAFDPAILILDEATANIDTHTENLIQDAIKKISSDRTTIVVAHRLSTIKNSSKILVLHHGHLVEEGQHDDLIKKKGLYYNLYLLQYEKGKVS